MNVRFLCTTILLALQPAFPQTGTGAEPVRYMGGVSIDLTTPEGRLRPAVGVESVQVFRANRSHPELADGYSPRAIISAAGCLPTARGRSGFACVARYT